MRVRGRGEGTYRTAIHVRDFPPFHTAEPEKLGGDDSAPTPMEVLLGAYVGCLAVVIELVAGELGTTVRDIDISAEGGIDRRGLRGVPGVHTHFQNVDVRVTLRSPASPEERRAIESLVPRRSPGHNLLADAGIPVSLAWEWVAE